VFRNKSHTISTVLLSLIIVSCGGGGGGGEGGQSNAISNSSSTSGGTATTPAYVEISSSSDSVLIETSVIISWESSDATTCSASGAWSGSKALRGTEEVTISIPGNNRFTISCSSSSSSASKYVDVEGYRIFDGITLDGYIRGADIFLDENDNFIADANENYSTSDNDGRFYDLKYYDGNLISLGGSDLDTSILLDGLLLLNKLDGFSSLKVITPITSISAFMESPSNINAALGIDSSIDITKTDPIANLGDNGVYDYLYEKGNQSTTIALTISNALNSYNSTTDTTEDYFKAIAEELELSYEESNGIIDIEDESFINKVIENLTLTKANDLGSNEKDNIKSALHAVIPIIEVKNNASATTAIQNFAFSTLQSDIKNIATGSATSSTINNYQNDIYNYIASDQNIPIEELNKAPKITSDSTFTAAENQTSIGAVTASDEDDTNLSYSLSGTDSNLINIDSSGILSFISAPNYETKSSYSITVSVTDGTNTATQSITINISDENDAPVITSSSSYNADENQTAVGIVTATDEDNDTLSYSLSGTNASALNINDSGVITFNADPNYEAQNTYSITVTVSDGSTNVTQSVTINIGNINESPVITSSASLTFNNNDDNLLVGNIEVTDPENSDLIYSLSGDDASALSINSLGELSFNGTPDKTNYTVIVSVSDGVNTVTQTITITVTSNDAPVITSSASFSVNENQTSIGTVMATDADGDTLTYSLSGTDAAAISISTNGVMTFNVAPDYEIKTTYTVTVNVSDGTNTTSQTITININDLLNEDETVVTGTVIETSPYSSGTRICYSGMSSPDVSGTTISGSWSGNTLTGSSGNDFFDGQGGDDLIDGKGGSFDKILIFDQCSNFTTRTLSGVTHIEGSSSAASDYRNDTIVAINVEWIDFSDTSIGTLKTTPDQVTFGSWSGNNLNGTNDNDIFDGLGGDDVIDGKDGTDTILIFGSSNYFELTTLSGVTKIDQVYDCYLCGLSSAYIDDSITSINTEKIEFIDTTLAINTDTSGANVIFGSWSGNNLNGTNDNDIFDGQGGDDVIDGKDGNDRILIFDDSSNYTITTLSGVTKIEGSSSAASDYRNDTITATNVEKIEFIDTTLTINTDSDS
jgi:hypothetical protein